MKILTSFSKVFRGTKVKKQLYFIYFSAIIIPILIIGIFLILYARNLLLEHYENQVEADNTRVKSIMFDVTTSVYNISDEFFNDTHLQELLATRYKSKQEADRSCINYTKVNNYINKNTFISSIELYTENPTIHKYATIIPASENIKKKDWYQHAISHADITWKSLYSIDNWNHASQELCLIRRIPVISTKEYAVMVIKISNNYLKNRIQNKALLNTVSVNKDPVFFSTQRNLSSNYLPITVDYDKSQYQYSGQLTYENKNSIANISTLLPYCSKDRIYITTLDFDALPDINHIILICTATIIFASALPLVLINQFTNKFSARIITLRREMHKVSMGDYLIISDFKGEDEISEVYADLKVMIQSIQQMDARIYEAKIQEQVLKNQQQKMEFKMLASQINPHFLYNTLETIRMKALTEGNRDVANVIKLLGKSMHYVLENTGTSSTTLKKELDYISIYLTIQKLRFNDRVNYTLNVEDNMKLEDYQILPLLLQPIVENAILHGLEGTETNGQIVIEVKTRDELLLIDILDNGLGMNRQALYELTSSINEPNKKSTSSIGLYNINQRIKLFYGEAYGIKINSSPQKGTLVSLTLPLRNVKEE